MMPGKQALMYLAVLMDNRMAYVMSVSMAEHSRRLLQVVGLPSYCDDECMNMIIVSKIPYWAYSIKNLNHRPRQ